MRSLPLVLAVVLAFPLAAEAGKKKTHAPAAAQVAQSARAKQKAEQARTAAEAARAEAELADVRAGRAAVEQPPERNWTVQEEDKEKPPGFAAR